MTVSAVFGGASIRPIGPEIVGAPQNDRRCVVAVQGNFTPNDFGLSTAPISGSGNDTTSKPTIIVNEFSNDLRVKFEIKKPLFYAPNLGHCTIYNLAPESRARALMRGVRVTLVVGYGQALQVLGTISAQQISHRHDGSDWLSKFEGSNGGRSFNGARLSSSFSAGTAVGEAMNKMIGATGLKLPSGSSAEIAKATGGKTFKNGFVVDGLVADNLRFLMLQYGLEYAVVDDGVLVLPKDGTTKEVFTIGPESGLVGSPEPAGPPALGKPQLVKCKVLLNPTLKPGALVVLKSESYAGNYRCRDVTHTGDTHSGDWYSQLELQGLRGSGSGSAVRR